MKARKINKRQYWQYFITLASIYRFTIYKTKKNTEKIYYADIFNGKKLNNPFEDYLLCNFNEFRNKNFYKEISLKQTEEILGKYS